MPTVHHTQKRMDSRTSIATRLITVALMASAALALPSPTATANPCPDTELIFARGTFETPGVGSVGQSFADALRARLGPANLAVHPVNYPASLDFATAADGVIDASNEVLRVAAACPNTHLVLGGYSQGAAVSSYVTADEIPGGYTPPDGITGPLPPEIADHISAIVLFGKPSNRFLNIIHRDAPPITVGKRYTSKTMELCAPKDPVCSTTGFSRDAHRAYTVNGMIDQGAEFAAHQVVNP